MFRALFFFIGLIGVWVGVGISGVANAADLDVEVDPIAFALKGYSLHLGASWKTFGRLDIGAYGLDYPASVLASDKFEASFTGVGVKYDFVPTAASGFFCGIQGSGNRIKAKLISTGTKQDMEEVTVGIRAGWRFWAGRFYVAPWGSLDYMVRGSDIVVDGETLKQPHVSPFLTLHIGFML